MLSHPMAYHRIIHTTMYTDEDNSTDLIGAFCDTGILFLRSYRVPCTS
jgi:diaminopimelate decarboxylase